MLPNPLKTQNLNRKNEATCWNCPLKLFQNSAIRDPLSCDYKKDSQWSTFVRQLSKPPPSVDVSSSIGNSNWEKFLIHCVFMNIPFPPSGSNMFSVKNFPKNILRNCLHSLVAGTTRRLSLLLFSYVMIHFRIGHTRQFFLKIWIDGHIWVKGVLLHL